MYDEAYVYGNDGNDTWIIQPYGLTEDKFNEDDYFFGGAGNDIVRGTHRAEEQYLYGGPGDDRVYGGDGAGRLSNGWHVIMAGGDGNDFMQAGANLGEDLEMYGDNPYDPKDDWEGQYGNEQQYITEFGDDIMYGSDDLMGIQKMIGGGGNDRLILGDNTAGRVRAWGDSR